MMCEKISEAAKEKGIDVVANAYAVTDIQKVIDDADIILLGPQVRFKLNSLQKSYGDKGVPFIVMQPEDYGRLNGENILNAALAAIEENKNNKN
jgi:PTS system cellobiose-specific IIB component